MHHYFFYASTDHSLDVNYSIYYIWPYVISILVYVPWTLLLILQFLEEKDYALCLPVSHVAFGNSRCSAQYLLLYE